MLETFWADVLKKWICVSNKLSRKWPVFAPVKKQQKCKWTNLNTNNFSQSDDDDNDYDDYDLFDCKVQGK